MRPLPAVDGVAHDWTDLPTGVRLHVASAGEPDAPAVLCVHGWPQHWWLWRHVIPLLKDEFRLICPDLRGLGWSGWPADGDFRKQRFADDLLALLDALELNEAAILGHDWGGWAAFLAAAKAPERIRALLACNICHPWQPIARGLRNAPRMGYQVAIGMPLTGPRLVADGRFVEAMLRFRFRNKGAWDDAEMREFVDVLREPRRAAASSAIYRQFLLRETAPGILTARKAPVLPMPVRFLFGMDDPGIDSALLEGIGAPIECVPHCGHFIVDERPELVAARARSFFAPR